MRQRGLARLVLVCACAWSSLPAGASAQLHRVTDPVATPVSTLLQRDDAAAIDVNPSSLGLMPAWSLIYVHAQVNERDG